MLSIKSRTITDIACVGFHLSLEEAEGEGSKFEALIAYLRNGTLLGHNTLDTFSDETYELVLKLSAAIEKDAAQILTETPPEEEKEAQQAIPFPNSGKRLPLDTEEAGPPKEYREYDGDMGEGEGEENLSF